MTSEMKSRVDRLLDIELKAQKWWEDEDVFRAESCEKAPKEGEKFFSTFPFPYMNGHLHIGHAFSVSKADFGSAYHRLKGANVLLPFGFHCTGMPIKASADKLCREIQQYGNPPVFTAEDKSEQVSQVQEESGDKPALPGQYKGKKSKVAAKSSGQVHQWEIMRGFGLTDNEIADFQDPSRWLYHFPPLAVEDLKSYGLGCDWRRSFVTTDVNPFFDSFVKWQMSKLKSMGKIFKDKTYRIFSPLAGQPCDDQDRVTGEGVQPQDYTLIKMEVQHPFPLKLGPLEGKRVFLAAATLRPETMYGQTNAWVLPDGEYGAYEINETDVFIITERAALNLAYQNLSKVPQKPSCLVELTGFDLIGIALRSPLSVKEVIYVLPMLTILTNKGTGILTSVPSDAPDDYIALRDLKTKKKPDLRIAFHVKNEWVMPFDIVPIINIPEFGDKAAEKVCMDLKIKSQLDKEKLEDAKNLIHRKSFSKGKMIGGEFVGRKVEEIRQIIKETLIESGEAVLYSEPEKAVTSRLGDECVVALTDKWYIKYGEEEWRKMAKECLSQMNLYSEETRRGIEHTLSCLNLWTCSSSFGPGTHIPWDERFFVESLSDSSLYMAYYTVAHFFHDGDMYKGSNSSILPQQMSDEVWDYLFCDGHFPQSSDIPKEILRKMKQEFDYWYPLDLRASGKDLILNHLTFFIYNHTALMAKRNWPRGIRCNGHMMLNSEKMSNSTGNYRTLRQSIEEFSATVTRFCLADAGDGVEDAKFVSETAKAAVFRLMKELTWMKEMLSSDASYGSISVFADKVFENAINIAIRSTDEAYKDGKFKVALKNGFYDLQAARDVYRLSCGTKGMNRGVILRFIGVQTRLITPICPHFADHIWREILNKEGCVLTAGWPTSQDPDLVIKGAGEFLQDFIASTRKSLQKQITGRLKPPKQYVPVEKSEWKGIVYVSEKFEGWKAHSIEVLKSKFNEQTRHFAPDAEIYAELGERLNQDPKAEKFPVIEKRCRPFMNSMKDKATTFGSLALSLVSPFGELEVLKNNVELIKRQVNIEEIEFCSTNNPDDVQKAGEKDYILKQDPPYPGSPVAIFVKRLDDSKK